MLTHNQMMRLDHAEQLQLVQLQRYSSFLVERGACCLGPWWGLRDPCKTCAEIAIHLAQLKSTPTKPIGTAFKIFQHHSNISQSLG